jgi:hypothetical protein
MPSKRFHEAVALCREHHRTRKTFSGNGILKHLPALLEFADKIEATSGIDYGCGKGQQYGTQDDPTSLEQHLGFKVFKYDPAVPKFSTAPTEPADLVICADVLECVPEEDIDFVIEQIVRLTLKGLFVTVASGPSKKTFHTGENCHLTIRPEEWWYARFNAALSNAQVDHLLELVLLVS